MVWPDHRGTTTPENAVSEDRQTLVGAPSGTEESGAYPLLAFRPVNARG